MNGYPINFNIEDIIDTQYYEKRRTKVMLKEYRLIKIKGNIARTIKG